MSDLLNKMTEAEHLKDTIRCMENVLTDIADALDIPKEKHGDPDEIFDAVASLKEKAWKYDDLCKQPTQ